MADRFSGIGNIRPAYPVKPVEPSGKDRPSGERKRKPGQPRKKPAEETGNNEPSGNDSTTHQIDEYI